MQTNDTPSGDATVDTTTGTDTAAVAATDSQASTDSAKVEGQGDAGKTGDAGDKPTDDKAKEGDKPAEDKSKEGEAPVVPEKYEVPDGYTIEADDFKFISEVAKERGFTQEQFKLSVEKWQEMRNAEANRLTERWGKESRDSLGDKYDATVQAATGGLVPLDRHLRALLRLARPERKAGLDVGEQRHRPWPMPGAGAVRRVAVDQQGITLRAQDGLAIDHQRAVALGHVGQGQPYGHERARKGLDVIVVGVRWEARGDAEVVAAEAAYLLPKPPPREPGAVLHANAEGRDRAVGHDDALPARCSLQQGIAGLVVESGSHQRGPHARLRPGESTSAFESFSWETKRRRPCCGYRLLKWGNSGLGSQAKISPQR